MGFQSLLRQAYQISGSATYDDTLSMDRAEDYLDKSLEQDLNFLRSQFKVFAGEANWFDAPANNIADIDAGFSGSLSNIQAFTGQSSVTDGSPTYASTTVVDQNADLEAAIGQLDAELNAVSGSSAAQDLQDVTDEGAATTNALTVSVSGSIFKSLLITDDAQVGGALEVDGNILVDGTVDGVDIATFSSNTISFTGMDDATDGSPTYTSVTIVDQNADLEAAIGQLDAELNVVSGSSAAAASFTGMDDPTDATPTYSSTQYVTDGDDLEAAIGKLDAAITNVDIVKETELISSTISAEDGHTLPNSREYTVNAGSYMDVFYNGQLLQADTGGQERDYDETSSTSVTFHFPIPASTYITYVIRK